MLIRVCSVWPQNLNLNQKITEKRISTQKLDWLKNELIPSRGSKLPVCQRCASGLDLPFRTITIEMSLALDGEAGRGAD